MRIRLTPLNIVSALCLVASVLLLTYEQPKEPKQVNMAPAMVWFFGAMAVLVFIADLIFRRLVPDIRKLWIVEGMVVLFILIIMYILKASIK